MHPGASPEDLHAILSRFHTWAERHPANGGSIGKSPGRAAEAPAEGIREIPYEEAIRRHRSREAARSQRRTPPRAKTSAPETNLTANFEPGPQTLADDDPMSWIAGLPVVAGTEPVIELKATPPSSIFPESLVNPRPFPTGQLSTSLSPRTATSSPAKRPRAAKPSQRAISSEPTAAALPHLPARAFVDLPPSSLSTRHRPRRESPSRARQTKTEAALPAVSTSPAAPVQARPPLGQLPQTRPAATSVRPAARQQTASQPAQAPPPRPVQRSASRSTATRSTAKPQPRGVKTPPFSKILVNTLQQPKAALNPRKKSAPDRSRRITTRFSPAEERRIEKCAANLGITVSAYLRKCALAAVAEQRTAQEPAFTNQNPKPRRSSARPARQVSLYAAPQPSFLGGWLALLRNRFLGPPVRFSEEA